MYEGSEDKEKERHKVFLMGIIQKSRRIITSFFN
jgi:hypothetical protein